MLKELLQKHLNDESKANEILEEMKASKIYTTKEENLDIRYNKLKDDYEVIKKKDEESQKLIEKLKENNGDDLSSKVAEYEAQITTLEAQAKELALENAIKFELIENGAKPSDIDYLMFKIGKSEDLKIKEDGKLAGLDIEELKKTYSSNFETSKEKKVDVLDLKGKEPEAKDTISKEQFAKMGYQSRVKLLNENPELYKQLSSKE